MAVGHDDDDDSLKQPKTNPITSLPMHGFLSGTVTGLDIKTMWSGVVAPLRDG
jgi:uncharacterized protein YgfB (UPF0149 family)